MKSVTIAALGALISTGALAVPMAGHGHHHAGHHAALHLNKREIVWITEFEVETVTVMKTVYGDGSEPTGTADTLSAAETPEPVTFTSYEVASPSPSTSSVPAYTPAAITTTTTTEAPAPATTQPSTYAPAPAPETTTTTSIDQAPAPAPTTTTTTVVTTTSPPAATTSSSGSYSGTDGPASGTSYTGDFTWYEVGSSACGTDDSSDESVVAVSHLLFDSVPDGGNPNNNPLCGRMLTLTSEDGSITTTAKITDRCVGCALGDLDLSESLFEKFDDGSTDAGRLTGMKWSFQ